MRSPRLIPILWAGGLLVAFVASGCSADQRATSASFGASNTAPTSAVEDGIGTSALMDDDAAPSSSRSTGAGSPTTSAQPGSAKTSAARSPIGSASSSARSATAAVAPPLATAPAGRPDQDPTTSVPASGGAARTSIEAAVAARDLCALYAALGTLEISGRTVAEFRAGMSIVLDAVSEARAFVPDELAEVWAVLVRRTEAVVEAVSQPGATVSSASAVFADTTYRDAMEQADSWVNAHCG